MKAEEEDERRNDPSVVVIRLTLPAWQKNQTELDPQPCQKKNDGQIAKIQNLGKKKASIARCSLSVKSMFGDLVGLASALAEAEDCKSEEHAKREGGANFGDCGAVDS